MYVDLSVNFLHCTIESRNKVKIYVVDNIGPRSFHLKTSHPLLNSVHNVYKLG
jgi:hypothetical protein